MRGTQQSFQLSHINTLGSKKGSLTGLEIGGERERERRNRGGGREGAMGKVNCGLGHLFYQGQRMRFILGETGQRSGLQQ